MCVSKKGGKKDRKKLVGGKKQPNKGSSGQNRLLRGRGVQDMAETEVGVSPWSLSRTEWEHTPPTASHLTRQDKSTPSSSARPSLEKINKLL